MDFRRLLEGIGHFLLGFTVCDGAYVLLLLWLFPGGGGGIRNPDFLFFLLLVGLPLIGLFGGLLFTGLWLWLRKTRGRGLHPILRVWDICCFSWSAAGFF